MAKPSREYGRPLDRAKTTKNRSVDRSPASKTRRYSSGFTSRFLRENFPKPTAKDNAFIEPDAHALWNAVL